MTREEFDAIASQFKLDIAAFAKKAGERADDAVRKSMIDLGRSLVLMSPVGNPDLWKTKYPPKHYVGGTFRRNWQYGVDQEPNGIIEGTDAGGEATIAGLSAAITSGPGIGHTLYLSNALPYAMRLEFGWSTQVRITAERWGEFVAGAVGEAST